MGFMLPSPTNPREHARALISQKENIEAELDAQFSILKVNNIDMTTPLVDREGFPRADVDLYAIRHARKRINELRNDYKAVMNEIETALQAVYDPSTAGSSPVASQEVSQHASLSDSAESLVAFARVDGVAPNSPAAEAVRLHQAHRRDDIDRVSLAGSSARRSDIEVWISRTVIVYCKFFATTGRSSIRQ
jgi:26S proteasome non-ATPase regulatory subunit 9